MEQVFIENTKQLSPATFDAELFRLRNLIEAAAAADPEVGEGMYVCSISCQTITYKGQLTPGQLMGYFKDLQDPSFASHFALVHSRFSTNTFPSWPRAQPKRMMCHNGEINTLQGNRSWLQSRAALMTSPVIGDSLHQEGHPVSEFIPVTQVDGASALATATETPQGTTADSVLRQATNLDGLSDSGCFDKVLELSAKASHRSLPECMMLMIPEAWQSNPALSPDKRAFYQYNACVMEPWDGPAMIAFTDGRFLGATLDRNGLRPSRYYITHEDVVLLASEVGVVPDLPDSEVKHKLRVEPGKMFLIDFEEGMIVPDSEVKEAAAAAYPYADWLKGNQFTLADWVAATPHAQVPRFDFYQTLSKMHAFGYTTETLDMLLYPMAVEGKEMLGSMGNDAALAVLSRQPRSLFEYFKQRFAQVQEIRSTLVVSVVSDKPVSCFLLCAGDEPTD
jgi:glutamate synthase domain-containing protein 1